MSLAEPRPILRIFDETKAREFYVDFLGFTIDWQHRFEPGLPVYMQVSRGACVLHLSEHHGDGSPGAALRIESADLDAFHVELLSKDSRYARPGIDVTPWGTRDMSVKDPFGNRLTFTTGRRAPMRPRDLVQAWVEAFNRADAEGLAAFYTEDAVNHQVAESPVHGREAIRRMFVSGFATATMHCIVEHIFEDGDWAILEWRDPLGLRGCGFFHVLDGKIVLQRGYWDKLSFLRTQGLPVPDPR